MREKFINRVGEVRTNTKGKKMWIVVYENWPNIWVQFEGGDILHHTNYGAFCDGHVSSRKKPSNPKDRSSYNTWRCMIRRCGETWQQDNPAYRGCECVEEWLDFENFESWYNENYYDIGERLDLDKDILVPGNKVYGPETCVFVPRVINIIFTRDGKRSIYPVGVRFNKKTGKYQAVCTVGSRVKTIGLYSTPAEASIAYKLFKAEAIRNIAESYKPRIPGKVYESIMKFSLDIETSF